MAYAGTETKLHAYPQPAWEMDLIRYLKHGLRAPEPAAVPARIARVLPPVPA